MRLICNGGTIVAPNNINHYSSRYRVESLTYFPFSGTEAFHIIERTINVAEYTASQIVHIDQTGDA